MPDLITKTWRVRHIATLTRNELSRFRATIRQMLNPVPNGQHHPPATIGYLVEAALRQMVSQNRLVLLTDARARLAEIGRAGHLLDLETTMQDDWETLACVWTFSDPQTAMLFRLGLE